MKNELSRRGFLRKSTAVGLGVVSGGMMLSGCGDALADTGKASMMGYGPGAKDLIKVGFVG